MNADRRINEHSGTRNGLWLGALLAVFIVSRVIFHRLGISFDMTPLKWYWQYIDPTLLRTRLIESTFYLHGQPPLFNLFMGGVLKAFPGHEAAAFAWIYRGFGLILMASIYLMMRGLHVRAWIAFALTALFMISPAGILYENWLFYSYPLAALLCLSALFLHYYLRTGRIGGLVHFFALLAVVVLTRSLFHLAWFLACFLLVLAYRRHEWRRIVLAGLVPLAAVSFLYFKNLVLFDTFAGSTWMGMSLSKMTTFRLPEEERESLVRNGTLSGLARVKPFSQIHAYKPLVPAPEPTGIAVLDQEKKAGAHPNMNTNFNNLIFVGISRQYLKDSRTSLRMRPSKFLNSVATALGVYFRPASDYVFFEGNRAHIRAYDYAFSRVIHGQFLPRARDRESDGTGDRKSVAGRFNPVSRMGLLVLVGFAIFLVTGRSHLRAGVPGQKAAAGGNGQAGADEATGGQATAAAHGGSSLAVRLPLLFIYITVIYLTAVACLVEIGENNRFRFMVDPLIVVVIGLFVNDLMNRHRAGGQR